MRITLIHCVIRYLFAILTRDEREADEPTGRYM